MVSGGKEPSQENVVGARNETARLRNVAVGRKAQPCDGERADGGRNVAAKYSGSLRAEGRGDR